MSETEPDRDRILESVRMLAAMSKEWLTEKEAAFYCGVSESQFRAKRAEHGFEVKQHMGAHLYSRRMLHASIERAPSVSHHVESQAKADEPKFASTGRDSARVPFELRSVGAEEAGELLGYSPRYLCERLACLPDFPKRVDTGGRPRWIVGEILKWRSRVQERRANPRRRRKSIQAND